METLWERLVKNINSNHLIFVVLCCIIGYLFRASDTYHLKPVWRKRSEPHHYQNRLYPISEDRLPPPIITDLEGDGVNEIILITQDYRLTLLALPEHVKQDEDDQTLPHVVVKEKLKLPLRTVDEGGTSKPVAMATGFTVPYGSLMQIRKQIIVIVTDDWQIFCYNQDLELLWKQKLMNVGHIKDTYKVKDMGILITAHNVRKNDEGLIIVGGSFTHTVHKEKKTNESVEAEHGNHTTDDNTLTHFSSFAVSAKDGTLRWHHLPGDFGEVAPDVKDVHGDHHWKLGLKRHRLHVGEAPWTLYKQELYKYLPHLWRTLDDTKLTLGRFQKASESSSGNSDGKDSRHRSALTPEHVMGFAYGGHRPHSNHEHVENPNAVVISNHNGIEVLNLLTGRPITELQLPADSSLYIDIDLDGNIEQLAWGQSHEQSPCYMEVWRIYPLKEKIEQLSVCRITRLMFTSSWAYDEDNLKKVPPVVLKSVARKSGFFRHLLGHHLPKYSQKYDIITIGGVGRVSSWDLSGNVNWQVLTPANWARAGSDMRRKKDKESEQYTEYRDSFEPSRTLMSLKVFGQTNAIAIAGYAEIVIVDLQTGNLLAEHSLPCHPSSPLIVGDFDNDGLNDIVVTCRLGYIGFSLHHTSNHLYTAMYAVAVFAFILLLNFICSPTKYCKSDFYDDSSEED